MSEQNSQNLYFVKYARSQSNEMRNLDYQVLENAYKLGMIIPNNLEILQTDSNNIIRGKQMTWNLYYEYFELICAACDAGALPVEYVANGYSLFNKMSYSAKVRYLADIREMVVRAYEVLDMADAAMIESRMFEEISDGLDQLPDEDRLKALYYLSTGDELTDELQQYLEQDLAGSDISIDKLSPEEVAYLAQTATSRYLDKGAVVVNDQDVEISNTNNPTNIARNNTPITRERLKDMMNSNQTNQTNVVNDLRQKNTKAYTNIPGLNRPNIPVQPPVSSSNKATTTNLDYIDYQ